MAYKKYAYYNKGNKVAVVELESASEDSPTEFTRYISPKTDVTDGLEVEYSYAPTYRINDDSETVDVNSVTEAAGTFRLTLSTNVTLANDSYVYISGHPLLSGLHRVRLAASGSNTLFLASKYNGGSVSFSDPKPTLYKDVTALSDEDFEIDLTDYQAQAVVYYVKAKIAEDARDMEGREYFLRLFKKQMEKSSRAKKRGLYKVQGFWGMRK